MRHTPGPWTTQADDTFSSLGDRRIVGANLISPAVVFGGLGRETDANARLIAAAPELLAALRIARETIAMACGTTAPFVKQAFAIIDPAIAKAEGVQ